MEVAILRARAEWRRRWASYALLALVVALVGAVALTAVAGARRTRSVLDRYDRAARPAQVFGILAPQAAAVAEQVVRLPEVERGAVIANVFAFPEDGYLAFYAPVGTPTREPFHRELVVEGRHADPRAPDELVVPEPVARRYELEPGDRLTIHTPSREQGRCLTGELDAPRCASVFEAFSDDGVDVTRFRGPVVDLRVVGISRGVEDIGASEQVVQLVALTPGFLEEYGRDVYTRQAYAVRLREGVTPEEFQEAIEPLVPAEHLLDFAILDTRVDTLRSTFGSLANGLLVFGAVAALAGVVAIAQSVGRQVVGLVADGGVVAGLGRTRAQRAFDAAVAVAPAAFAGAALGVVGAWVASSMMPIGDARLLEPARGRDLDVLVLACGAGILVAIGLGAAVVPAARRPAVRGPRRLAALAARMTGRFRLPVPASVGFANALDPGSGRRTLPVRAALSAAALGVAGIAAVAVVGASMQRLADDPARHGWFADLTLSGELGPGGASVGSEDVESALAAEPGVTAVTRVWQGLRARVEGRDTPAVAQRFVEGDAGVVIVDGRAPVSADEVAAGAITARRAGVRIGDRLTVEGRELTVVGQAIFPSLTDGYPLAEGILVSERGMRALRLQRNGDAWGTRLAVRVDPDADRDGVLDRLARFNAGARPRPEDVLPIEVQQLTTLDRLPVVLAGFLAVLALVGVGHVLVLTVRRRGVELAALRALGSTKGTVSRVVTWQAVTMALAGTVAGVPAGVVVGRALWQRIADAYGVATDPAWPAAQLAVTVPLALAACLLGAALPARRARRLPVAATLRSE